MYLCTSLLQAPSSYWIVINRSVSVMYRDTSTSRCIMAKSAHSNTRYKAVSRSPLDILYSPLLVHPFPLSLCNLNSLSIIWKTNCPLQCNGRWRTWSSVTLSRTTTDRRTRVSFSIRTFTTSICNDFSSNPENWPVGH